MAEGEHECATADKLIDIMAPLLSGADGEAWANGALLSSRRAATSVASTPTTGGGVQTVSAVRWCYLAVMAIEWPPTRRDLPAQEREVTSLSVSFTRREG
jgi:hypothetical protein